jgi:hypothetical protein
MRAGLVGVAVLLAATASGGIEHTILHGVSVSHVRTWVGPDSIPGLTTEGVKAEAESGLKKAGIILDPGGQAELFVSATVLVADSGTCFVTLQGRLVEPATLDRNGFAVHATSWESAGTLITTADECAKPTTEGVRRALADFVEHYRAMNPKANRP